MKSRFSFSLLLALDFDIYLIGDEALPKHHRLNSTQGGRNSARASANDDDSSMLSTQAEDVGTIRAVPLLY